MVDSQDWRIDGTQLQTLGFNIATMGGRQRMAAARGGNIAVPYRHGTLWTPKYYEEQDLSLAMWVIGADPITGDIPSDPQVDFYSNLETLQQLFSGLDVLKVLTKKHPTLAADVVANCEVVDQVDFSSEAGATRAGFVVDLVLPEVWFEPGAYSTDGGPTVRADTAQWTVAVGGDVDTNAIRITLNAATGTPSNIRLTNESLGDGTDHYVDYLDVFATSEEVIIDVEAWTAELDGTTNVVNNVDWSGQPQFFRLSPGNNDLLLAVTGGPITVTFEWKAKYW